MGRRCRCCEKKFIRKYGLRFHDLISGGFLRETTRTALQSTIFFMQSECQQTRKRVYRGDAEETITWIDGSDIIVNDDGRKITLNRRNPAHTVRHGSGGKNALNFCVPHGCAMTTVTFVPPFDPSKLEALERASC